MQYIIIDSGKEKRRKAQSHLRAAEKYARQQYPASRFPFLRVRRISGDPQGDGEFEPVLDTANTGEPFLVWEAGRA